MTRENPLLAEVLTVAAFCAFLFYFGLGAFGLVGADEPRYAQIAREMLQRNDLVTPTLHGIVWLEKPALYYWRAMFAFRLFGVHDWAARLPSATFATAMIAIIYFHMRRFRRGAQLDAAVITASSAAIIGFARGASTDMQLAAPFAVAMLGWYAWYETRRKVWLVDFFFFTAIATLAKGPVAPCLAALIVILFSILRREPQEIFKTLWWPGVVLYCAVVLPWFVAVQIKNPEFLHIFIFEHNLERFATNMFRHAQPFWYYLPVMLLSLVPWVVFAVPAMWDAARGAMHSWRNPGAEPEALEVGYAFPEFLVLWTVVPIVFFSLSMSKLPGYILPSVPPCAILIADYLRRKRDDAVRTGVIIAHALVGAVIAGGGLLLPNLILNPRQMPPNQALLLAGVAAVVFFVGIFLTLRRAALRLLRFVTLVPVVLVLGFILRPGAPVVDAVYSARPVARELETMQASGSPTAVYQVKRELEYGLGFYRDQAIASYDRGEVPGGDHLLVAHEGEEGKLQKMFPQCRFSRLGGFAAQKVEFFWVSKAMVMK